MRFYHKEEKRKKRMYFLAILPYFIGGFGEIGRVSAVRSAKATEKPAGMSVAKIAKSVTSQ
jgi:hypothetical protein